MGELSPPPIKMQLGLSYYIEYLLIYTLYIYMAQQEHANLPQAQLIIYLSIY